jgi:pimeloyl-ACP methyl ester carboxylesterase
MVFCLPTTTSELRAIQVPTLIVWGDQDALIGRMS